MTADPVPVLSWAGEGTGEGLLARWLPGGVERAAAELANADYDDRGKAGTNASFGEDGGLSADHQELLAAFSKRLYRNRIELTFQPGEAVLWNNRRIVHARSAFTDGPAEEGKKRLLLRMWIADRDGDPHAVNPRRGHQARM